MTYTQVTLVLAIIAIILQMTSQAHLIRLTRHKRVLWWSLAVCYHLSDPPHAEAFGSPNDMA